MREKGREKIKSKALGEETRLNLKVPDTEEGWATCLRYILMCTKCFKHFVK